MKDNGCAGSGSGGARQRLTSLGSVPKGSVALYTLCEEDVVEATAIGASSWNETVISGEDIEGLGPLLQDLVIHAEGSNFSSFYRWRIILQYRAANGPWLSDASPVILLADTGNVGFADGSYRISAAFTDRTKLGLRMRIVLQTQVAAGQSGTQRGTMNAWAALRFFSC